MTWFGQMSRRRVEPEPGDLGQHLPLERDRGDDPVEGAQPVGRDDDPAAVRQVVIVADLAAVMVRQFGDRRVRQDISEMRRKSLPTQHLQSVQLLAMPAAATTTMEASTTKAAAVKAPSESRPAKPRP